MHFSTRYLKLHVRSQHEPGRQESVDLSHLDEHGQDFVRNGVLGRLKL